MPRAMYGSSADRREENLQAENLDKIEEGKQAAATAVYLNQPFLEQKETIIVTMINMYRSGKINHDRLIGLVAELAALDNLMQKLENTQRQAENAAQKEFGRG